MNPYKAIKTNPQRKDLLELGLVLLGGLCVAAALAKWRFEAEELAVQLLIVGAAVFILAQVPVVGRWLYVLWMGIGATLGVITSPIVLAVLYTVLFVPIAFIFRLLGRDRLHRKRVESGTYWEDYGKPRSKADYLRQF